MYDYQRLAAVPHDGLGARSKPHVDVFARGEGTWSGMRVLDGLDAILELPAVGATLPLARIYRRALDL